MEIKVKYLAEVEPIKAIEIGNWIDLRASKDVTLKQGEFAIVPLGIAIQLPKGYEAHIVPRSSTFKKWGVIQTNGVGVIDESYCGNDDQWGMPVFALRDTEIKVNDRICQFRLVKRMEELDVKTVDNLEGKNRGGFGSTGSN